MNKVGEAVAYMMDTGPPSSLCDDITLWFLTPETGNY